MTVEEKNLIINEPKISYEEYKILVNKDDIKKFSKKLKPFWWENFPLIGPMIYSIRIAIKMSAIDRGLLRREITVTSMIFVFSFLIYIFMFLTILTPWFSYWMYATAVKKAQKKIENSEQN